MMQQRQEATWPFLCILACLFILSATSPRAWEQPASDASVAEASSDAVPTAPALTPPSEMVHTPSAEYADPRPDLDEGASSMAAVEPAKPIASLVDVAEAEPVQPAATDVAESEPEPADAVEPQPLPEPQADSVPELVFRSPSQDAMAAVEPEPEPRITPQEPAPASTDLTVLADEAPRVAMVPDRAKLDAQPLVEKPVEMSEPEPAEEPAADVAVEAEQEVKEPAWPTPTVLIAQLEELGKHPEMTEWTGRVLAELARLNEAAGTEPAEVPAILDRLTELGVESGGMEERLGSQPLARKLQHLRYSLYRRLDIWRQVMAAGGPAAEPQPTADVDFRTIEVALADLDAITAGSPEGRAWRRYLMLDALHGVSAEQQEAERRDQQQQVARRILRRLDDPGMDAQQQAFVHSGPVARLERELRALTADPVPLADVVEHLETYESTGLPGDARQVGEDCQRLRYSTVSTRQALGKQIDSYYRNGNLRIVVTEDLMNRLMPARDPEYRWVNDTVLGSTVRGRSLAFTDLAIRTVPDPERLKLALEVTGRITSSTTATNGPARFFNRSEAVYVARKPMEVSLTGLKLWPSVVGVRNSTQLRGLETDFDPIPLVGSLVQEVARSQHDAKRWEADRVVERKVALQAKTQVDNETEARMTKVSEQLRDRVLGPLDALSLGPEVIECSTSETRLTMRLRLGDDTQLGGNTPRPWAPSDSLASVQIHESALNNALEKLQLDGRTFTLAELRAWIAKQVNLPELANRTNDHDDVRITFAAKDAVTVRCQEGRLVLTMDVVELVNDPHVWNDFKIRVFYRAEVDGQSARLVRDGVVRVIGRLPFRSQIGVRGVFGTTFSRDKPVDLTPERLSSDPRMADLALTQFLINDGWIGVALGPKERMAPPELTRRVESGMGPTF